MTHQAISPSFNPQSAVMRARKHAAAVPLVLKFEAHWQIRAYLMRALGVAMLLSAAGIWLVHGNSNDPEMNLIKVGVSLVFAVLGLILVTLRDHRDLPEVCFDPVRQELRALKRDRRGRARTVLRRRYDTIGGARLTETSAIFYERDGSFLVEVPLDSSFARSQLRDQLSGAVQLFS